MTKSMHQAISITHNRRKAQEKYNKEHGITPKTIIKSVEEQQIVLKTTKHLAKTQVAQRLIELEAQMNQAAENLDFETAISLRDEIKLLKQQQGIKE